MPVEQAPFVACMSFPQIAGCFNVSQKSSARNPGGLRWTSSPLAAVLPASTKTLVMEPNRPVAGRRHTHAYTLPQRMEWGAKKNQVVSSCGTFPKTRKSFWYPFANAVFSKRKIRIEQATMEKKITM